MLLKPFVQVSRISGFCRRSKVNEASRPMPLTFHIMNSEIFACGSAITA